MGKAARERARRAAEKAAPPKLIVVEDPAAPVEHELELDAPEGEAPERPPGQCPVVGCPNLGLCRHDTPDGAIWLCGRCDMVARRNLADEAHRQETIDALAAPAERQIAHRMEKAQR